jgi:phage-related tail protein
MDIGKDNSKGEGIVKFVEGFGARTNPFGDNRVGERAYRRAERISAALFLLTSHVSDTEPLRLKVRATAVGILDDVLALRAEMRSLNSERIVQLKSSVRELISLTRILAVAGYVSTQNAAVVAEALDELSSFLAASQRSPLSESASFNREDFLDVREPAPPRS